MKKDLEAAVEQNLIENYNKYYRLAYSYVHNEADAMDIVQEGAYKAILKSASVKKKEFIDSWIYRIMINEALGFIRKNKQEYLELEEIQAVAPDAYKDMDLRNAIAQLEPLDRTIMILRFFEDFKLKQIAEITNENVSTVKSRLYRTLKQLKISLAE